MTNLYHILDLEKGASDIEIKKAFRRLSKKYHPDSKSEFADAEKFKLIHSAYSILIDYEKRKYYDPMLENDDNDEYIENWKIQADNTYKKYADMDYEDYVERNIRLHMFSADPKKEKQSVIVLIIATLVGLAAFLTWYLYPIKDLFSINMLRTGVTIGGLGSILCFVYIGIYRNNKKIRE